MTITTNLGHMEDALKIFSRLEDMEPSDSNTLTDQEVKDLDDLIML